MRQLKGAFYDQSRVQYLMTAWRYYLLVEWLAVVFFITCCESTHLVFDLSDSFETAVGRNLSSSSHGVFIASLDGALRLTNCFKSKSLLLVFIVFILTDCVFSRRSEQYAIEHWLFSLLTSESWVFGRPAAGWCAREEEEEKTKICCAAAPPPS